MVEGDIYRNPSTGEEFVVIGVWEGEHNFLGRYINNKGDRVNERFHVTNEVSYSGWVQCREQKVARLLEQIDRDEFHFPEQ